MAMSSSAKYLNSDSGTIIQAPLVAELDVETTKRVSNEMVVPKADRVSSESTIKQNVISQALQSTSSDVMIEPRFTIKKDNNGEITYISVTGYVAKYSSFRQMELKDTLLLDGIYGRQQQLLNPYNATSSAVTTPAEKKSLFSSVTNIFKGKSKEGKESPSYSRKQVSASLSYSYLLPFAESVDTGKTFSLSVGYGTRTFSYGAYMDMASLDSNEGQSFKNKDIGAYVHYNILRGKFTPFVRANVGYKFSDELTYISPDYQNNKVIDYGAAFGMSYIPKGRSGLSLYVSFDRMVYASDYDGTNFARAEDYINPSVGVRYNFVFGDKR